jgi:hypothetical protein
MGCQKHGVKSYRTDLESLELSGWLQGEGQEPLDQVWCDALTKLVGMVEGVGSCCASPEDADVSVTL